MILYVILEPACLNCWNTYAGFLIPLTYESLVQEVPEIITLLQPREEAIYPGQALGSTPSYLPSDPVRWSVNVGQVN